MVHGTRASLYSVVSMLHFRTPPDRDGCVPFFVPSGGHCAKATGPLEAAATKMMDLGRSGWCACWRGGRVYNAEGNNRGDLGQVRAGAEGAGPRPVTWALQSSGVGLDRRIS